MSFLTFKRQRGSCTELSDCAVSADFHATGSGQGSGELVAQGAVAPPGDGGVGGEVGFAQHGRVGASLQADGDGVAVVDDGAWGFQEAALQGVGGGGVVAGQPLAQGGQQGLGEDGGRIVAQAGDDELAEGAGVAGQPHGGRFVDAWAAVGAGAVQGDGGVVGRGQAVDVAKQGG